jgi:hypothetical protein
MVGDVESVVYLLNQHPRPNPLSSWPFGSPTELRTSKTDSSTSNSQTSNRTEPLIPKLLCHSTSDARTSNFRTCNRTEPLIRLNSNAQNSNGTEPVIGLIR